MCSGHTVGQSGRTYCTVSLVVKPVFLQAAQYYLDQGKQSLILVPKCTYPSLIGRVQLDLKSSLSAQWIILQERLREWRRIRAGEADVAVGARSALFAPFPNLGLLIVDEEHDDSYKQGDGVRYHARDMAVVRGIMKVSSGSGVYSPKCQSWFNAHKGRYELLRIKRATPASPR